MKSDDAYPSPPIKIVKGVGSKAIIGGGPIGGKALGLSFGNVKGGGGFRKVGGGGVKFGGGGGIKVGGGNVKLVKGGHGYFPSKDEMTYGGGYGGYGPKKPLYRRVAHVGPLQQFCPFGWDQYHGSCYYFSRDRLTWYEASVSCYVLNSEI